DLTQEILLVVFREVGGFERRGQGAFRVWLRTILVHRVRDHCRKRQARPAATGDSDFQRRLDEMESPDSGLTGRWNREHDEHVAGVLRRGGGGLGAAVWQAFRRHVRDRRPATEVAAELGQSLNSVLLAKNWVLKRLRQELAGLLD